MHIKYKILEIINDSGISFISGETISSFFGISRAFVWKKINELRKEGYIIESSPKKGYRLTDRSDTLNELELKKAVSDFFPDGTVYYFEKAGSTNAIAKKIAAEGSREGTIVAAGIQTAGRGRMGREWSSNNNKGIWFSIVLKPDIIIEDITLITLAASVSVCQALEKGTGIRASIKWPNDIILDGKKLCGILAETNVEFGNINYLILGIGINYRQSYYDFDIKIRDTATSLKIFADTKYIDSCSWRKGDIIRKVTASFYQLYRHIINGETQEVINQWKEYSTTLGKQIRYTMKNESGKGIAVDITNHGELLIKKDDGSMFEANSGEISIKGIMGYV